MYPRGLKENNLTRELSWQKMEGYLELDCGTRAIVGQKNDGMSREGLSIVLKSNSPIHFSPLYVKMNTM